jgi:hypothetical protein
MERRISPRAEHDFGVGKSAHRRGEVAARQQRTVETLLACRLALHRQSR